MKIQIDTPKFSGEYTDNIDDLKKGLMIQNSYPKKYFLVVCFKNGDKYKQLVLASECESPKNAFLEMKTEINMKKKKVWNGSLKKYEKFECFMPRTKVPEIYRDVLKPCVL